MAPPTRHRFSWLSGGGSGSRIRGTVPYIGRPAPLRVQIGPKRWPRGPARDRRSIVRIRPVATRLVANMRFGKLAQRQQTPTANEIP